MNVLIIGSGGREHTLAWKIAQSPRLKRLYVAPGNAGTCVEGENIPVNVNDFDEIKKIVLEKNIDMLVVGPEVPLVAGIQNYFAQDSRLINIAVIGPSKEGAMLEGSKDFAKDFMNKYKIPTASHQTFTKNTLNEAKDFLKTLAPPYVLKADGLAAGKGVIICEDFKEAENNLYEMLEKEKFGSAGEKVIIEEFLSGIEISVFVLTDGKSYKMLPEAKDYKRIGEGDTGLNTGGMGSVSPVPFANPEFMKKVEDRIIKPTIEGLQNENIIYKGFIFFGLINVNGDPYVIEYNCRMGDPEAEAVIPRIKSDLLEMFIAVNDQKLDDCEVEINPAATASVFLVSGGYPEKYEKGKIITGFDKVTDSIIFHAGTATDGEAVKTSGGRILALTSFGKNINEALGKSYKNARLIKFDKKYYRKDIGNDLTGNINDTK